MSKIYKNEYCPSVPTYFVPLSKSGRNTNGMQIKFYDGKWNLNLDASYDSSDLKDSENFPVVGSVDIEQTIIQALLSGVEK